MFIVSGSAAKPKNHKKKTSPLQHLTKSGGSVVKSSFVHLSKFLLGCQ